ncbi:MAG: hypothetical protein JNL61_01015 [Rhizobiaceae bacterium]|nr:hypothetical protein [Rhizobiaceae bacterium]
MKSTALKAALVLAASCLPASAQSIGGSYTVSGTNFNGSAYEGTAEITLTSETTCVIEWVTGGTNSQGICMRNDDSFAAAYLLGNKTGLVVYKVMQDGSMHGLWTIAAEEGHGTEVLTPAE